MADRRVRISELPPSNETKGLMTIGVNASNESVKIPIGKIVDDLQAPLANAAAVAANADKTAQEAKTMAADAVTEAKAAMNKSTEVEMRVDAIQGDGDLTGDVDTFDKVVAFLDGEKAEVPLSQRLSAVSFVAPSELSFYANADIVRLNYGVMNVNGEGGRPDVSTLPLLPMAEAPTPGDGMIAPQPGNAGAVTAAQVKRWDDTSEGLEAVPDEILRPINEALEGILGEGEYTPGEGGGAATTFVSGGGYLQRGMMKATALPGVVYDCYKGAPFVGSVNSEDHVFDPSIGYVKFDSYHEDSTSDDGWRDYGKAFPNGKFYGKAIEFDIIGDVKNTGAARETLEVDTENMRVRAIQCEGTVLVAMIQLPSMLHIDGDSYHHYLTKDASGRVMIAENPIIEHKKLPSNFVLKELCDGTDTIWAYALSTTGERLELQWMHRTLPSTYRRNGDIVPIRFYAQTRFHRVHQTSKRMVTLGIFRVRRHTNRGYRSDWVYYTHHNGHWIQIK